MKWLTLVLLFLISAALPLSGQQITIDSSLVRDDRIQVLQTMRGDVFFGKLQSLEADSLTFEVQDLAPIRFSREEIQHLDRLEDAVWLKVDNTLGSNKFSKYREEEDFWEQNLAYSPTAFSYEQGEGEYRNISILYNVIDVGVSDEWSIGGGIVIPFLFMFRTKIAFDVGEKVHLGAGMNNFVGLDNDIGGLVSHIYAVGTVGTPEQFLNFTIGPAFVWGEPDDNVMVVTAGGAVSFGSHWKIYADLGASPGNDGVIPTIMLSWFKNKNRLELGMLGVADGFFSAIPMVGYARRF